MVTLDFQAQDIHAKNLYDERYICAVRHDHPIAQQTELTLEQFCQLEQALIFYLSWQQLQRCYRPSPASDGATKKCQPIGTKLYCLA
ncbi:hypothetical protein O3681_02250 [Neisseria sp. 27098_8_158]|uniref:hypothetical protein n=1 Tax=Neisseria sp. 27098_8_158 TaxID=3003680 RepID=UPI00352DC642